MATSAPRSSSRVKSGVAPNSVMLARIGTFTASANRRYIARSVIASGKIMSAPASTQATRALDRRVEAFDRERVGARHDRRSGVGARVDRRLDAVDHLVLRHDLLARPVAAALGADLVFDVHRRRRRP